MTASPLFLVLFDSAARQLQMTGHCCDIGDDFVFLAVNKRYQNGSTLWSDWTIGPPQVCQGEIIAVCALWREESHREVME